MSNQNTPPPAARWVPLADVLKLLNHPDFHWCVGGGLSDLKYMELRIDTRDNCCLVMDRNRKPVDLSRAAKALESPYLKGMNDNPAVEVHSKETMDEVKADLEATANFAEAFIAVFNSGRKISLERLVDDFKVRGINARVALAKLNPPTP